MSRPGSVEGTLPGHYAGAVTRGSAFVIDVIAIITLFAVFGTVVEYVLTVLPGDRVRLSEAPLASTLALLAWAFLYFVQPLAASGATLGMAFVGVRAVRADGSDLDGGHAVLRVLALPLSVVLLGLGFLPLLLRRDRRALHDLIASTAVVYA